MKSRDNEISPIKTPQFIRIAIEQIRVSQSTFNWMDEGNFYPMSIPSVKKQALDLLQLLQPILVVPLGKQLTNSAKKEMPVYSLVAGRRTLQLISEQMPRQTKVRVIKMGDNPFDTGSYEIMDFLCSVLLRRPDDETKTMLAASLLEDTEFKNAALNFIDVSTQQKIASMLGISRASLNRLTTSHRQKIATPASTSAYLKTTLGIIRDLDSENKT